MHFKNYLQNLGDKICVRGKTGTVLDRTGTDLSELDRYCGTVCSVPELSLDWSSAFQRLTSDVMLYPGVKRVWLLVTAPLPTLRPRRARHRELWLTICHSTTAMPLL